MTDSGSELGQRAPEVRKVNYTHVTFATPRARLDYAEASLEVGAREVVTAFASGDEQRFASALDELREQVEELDRARAAEEASRAPEGR